MSRQRREWHEIVGIGRGVVLTTGPRLYGRTLLYWLLFAVEFAVGAGLAALAMRALRLGY